MQVFFSSAAFFFDPLLALGGAAHCRAGWGAFARVTSFYGNGRAKFSEDDDVYAIPSIRVIKATTPHAWILAGEQSLLLMPQRPWEVMGAVGAMPLVIWQKP